LEWPKSLCKDRFVSVQPRAVAPRPFDNGVLQQPVWLSVKSYAVQYGGDAFRAPKLALQPWVALVGSEGVRFPEPTTASALSGEGIHQVAHCRIVQPVTYEHDRELAEQLQHKACGISVTQVSIAEVGASQNKGAALCILRILFGFNTTVQKSDMAQSGWRWPGEQRGSSDPPTADLRARQLEPIVKVRGYKTVAPRTAVKVRPQARKIKKSTVKIGGVTVL
jgi:hypothetical protein